MPALSCRASRLTAPERVASHHKLEAERNYAELRADERARREADRKLGRFFKQHKKELRRRGKGSC